MSINSPFSREERERHVAEAIHSVEMEGLTLSKEGRKDAQDFIEGLIDLSEMLTRARTRYGIN